MHRQAEAAQLQTECARGKAETDFEADYSLESMSKRILGR